MDKKTIKTIYVEWKRLQKYFLNSNITIKEQILQFLDIAGPTEFDIIAEILSINSGNIHGEIWRMISYSIIKIDDDNIISLT